MTKGELSFSDRRVKQNWWDHVITTPCSDEQELSTGSETRRSRSKTKVGAVAPDAQQKLA